VKACLFFQVPYDSLARYEEVESIFIPQERIMISNFDVPDELKGSFKRIARRIPVDLRTDEELVKTLLAFLALGGEKLARQAVDSARQTLELEKTQKRKKAREEALIRAAEARQAAAEADAENDSDAEDEEPVDENDL